MRFSNTMEKRFETKHFVIDVFNGFGLGLLVIPYFSVTITLGIVAINIYKR